MTDLILAVIAMVYTLISHCRFLCIDHDCPNYLSKQKFSVLFPRSGVIRYIASRNRVCLCWWRSDCLHSWAELGIRRSQSRLPDNTFVRSFFSGYNQFGRIRPGQTIEADEQFFRQHLGSRQLHTQNPSLAGASLTLTLSPCGRLLTFGFAQRLLPKHVTHL